MPVVKERPGLIDNRVEKLPTIVWHISFRTESADSDEERLKFCTSFYHERFSLPEGGASILNPYLRRKQTPHPLATPTACHFCRNTIAPLLKSMYGKH